MIEYSGENVKNVDLEILDFYANWCSPCKLLSMTLDKLEIEFNNNINIYKIDIEKYEDVVKKYNIMSIPTLIFLKNGQLVETITGNVSIDIIKSIISNWC